VELPSICTLHNLCWREYSVIEDETKKQLPSRNKVGSALYRQTSAEKLVKTLAIAYYTDRISAFRKVTLTFDYAGNLFFSYVAS
jgi:hypothetical protein